MGDGVLDVWRRPLIVEFINKVALPDNLGCFSLSLRKFWWRTMPGPVLAEHDAQLPLVRKPLTALNPLRLLPACGFGGGEGLGNQLRPEVFACRVVRC